MILGSTFIAEDDRERVRAIAKIDDLEYFESIALDVMTTLDFVLLLVPTQLQWTIGEPIQFDEEDGIAIFQVNPESLAYVIGVTSGLNDDQMADVQKLQEFVTSNAGKAIYELSTF